MIHTRNTRLQPIRNIVDSMIHECQIISALEPSADDPLKNAVDHFRQEFEAYAEALKNLARKNAKADANSTGRILDLLRGFTFHVKLIDNPEVEKDYLGRHEPEDLQGRAGELLV